jgi:hypothetical protein
MTIANGYSSFGSGGDIYNLGTVTIDRCTLAGNRPDRKVGTFEEAQPARAGTREVP